MNADEILQELSIRIYEPPLSNVRTEVDYPNLNNPLHLSILLIDCDTEINMNGMTGFLENSTGQHLAETIQALHLIGASKSGALLDAVQACMAKHGVTWERLRGDFSGAKPYQITSFRELHCEQLRVFAEEVHNMTAHFSLFNTRRSQEDVYGAFCSYTEARLVELQGEIDKRIIPD
jgi:hypothetical protein